ncbi:MAG: hypothetical protein HPY52_10745 [Firmicutes bacterium]|nr:hypothetical protein [Bacillota bacterium]
MGDICSLYYDKWIRASYRLLDYLVEAAEVWDALPDYRKEGKLVYFGQLVSYLAILRTGESTGKLTRAQIRKLRNLERLAEKAQKLIGYLEAKENERRVKAETGAATSETAASGEEAGGKPGEPEADS